MIEVPISGKFSSRTFNKFSNVKQGLKALDGVGISDSVHEIAIPMDKRAIHLVDLTFKIMVKKVKVFILFLEGRLRE
jgi:hypothetical protein